MTVNVPLEQSTKQTVRSNTRGGANSYTANPKSVIDAGYATNGLWSLSVTDPTCTFTISGGTTHLKTSTLSGLSTAGNLITALQAVEPSTVNLTTDTNGNQFLAGNKTDIIFGAGAGDVLTVISGTGRTPVITNITLASENVSYPNYVGTPNANPTWIDDATVHAYPVNGGGAVVQDTTKVVQVQVRQINTGEGPDGGSETQQWAAYYTKYQGNLNQTQQRNTKQQQC